MRVEVLIKIDYDEASMDGVGVITLLQGSMEGMISRGGLTGDSAAVVDEVSYEIDVKDAK